MNSNHFNIGTVVGYRPDLKLAGKQGLIFPKPEDAIGKVIAIRQTKSLFEMDVDQVDDTRTFKYGKSTDHVWTLDDGTQVKEVLPVFTRKYSVIARRVDEIDRSYDYLPFDFHTSLIGHDGIIIHQDSLDSNLDYEDDRFAIYEMFHLWRHLRDIQGLNARVEVHDCSHFKQNAIDNHLKWGEGEFVCIGRVYPGDFDGTNYDCSEFIENLRDLAERFKKCMQYATEE